MTTSSQYIRSFLISLTLMMLILPVANALADGFHLVELFGFISGSLAISLFYTIIRHVDD